MFIAITTVSLIALLLDVKYKHSFVLLGLNIAGGTASTLGIIAIIRYGFSGLHGKSYLSLTIGIILWFLADLIVYYYFIVGDEELIDISITDLIFYWIWISLFTFIFYYERYTKKNKSYPCYYYIHNYNIIRILYCNKFSCL